MIGETICPYCGSKMVFCGNVSKTETGKTVNSGYFACVRCKSRSPCVSEDAALETMKQIEDEALLMAIIRTEGKNRVLMLEEICGRDIVWIEEYVTGQLVVSPFFHTTLKGFCGYIAFQNADRGIVGWKIKSYKSFWRCWLRKPTKEEMEGTPWA